MSLDPVTVVRFQDGIVIHGTFPDEAVLRVIRDTIIDDKIPLVIADPPYGNIVDRDWDRIDGADDKFSRWMVDWSAKLVRFVPTGGALYVWGGIGKPAEYEYKKGFAVATSPFRPFLRYLVQCELETGWSLSTLITWKKRRAYGIQWGYLFTREECAYFVLGDVKKPLKFTVPLLEEKRGYAGYNERYPAKSEFLRRSNVWTDITEIMRGLVHINQKPRRLMEIPIEVHTTEGDWVLDPFAGSGTTAFAARKLNRRFILVEQDEAEYRKIVKALQEDSSRWA